MIEVEKKFQPTEEQWDVLLKDAKSITNKVLHDCLYDYFDYRMFKKGMRLRNRNGNFELKTRRNATIADEIEDKKEIEKYFNTDNLDIFIQDNLILIADYTQDVVLLEIDEFLVDVSKLSYGYQVGEVEILIGKDGNFKEAEEKIDNFGKKYNLEFKDLPGKPKEYFRIVKPEVYNKLYG